MNGAPQRSVLPQGEMCAEPIIVGGICRQDPRSCAWPSTTTWSRLGREFVRGNEDRGEFVGCEAAQRPRMREGLGDPADGSLGIIVGAARHCDAHVIRKPVGKVSATG